MAYLSLYRKYRPSKFEDVIGQDHIVKTLTNQIKNNTVSHAYLFCGTRGTGKTSCAKIFARSVNCLNPINGSACNECEVCLKGSNLGNLDVMEIDAASNNRVDEIRDLREKINYPPTVGKYKVYIIDEVHMLTDSAFNALLKTLEEPPSYAIFILCTTEVHKLPATILSRCTRLDFKLVSNEDLVNHLKRILPQSNIKFDEESLQVIAKAGQGSVRDTLSVAEMCASFCDNNITYEKTISCLGITNNQTLFDISSCLINKDCGKLLTILNNLKQQGKNLALIIKDLSMYINNVLTVKFLSNANEILCLPNEDYNNIKSLADNSNENSLLKYLQKFSEIDSSIKQSYNPNLIVQTALLNCIVEDSTTEEILTRLDNIEKKTKNVIVSKIAKENVSSNAQESIGENNAEKKTEYSAKQIFGEMIQFVKSKNLFVLYAVFGDVKNFELNNNEFTLHCSQSDYVVFKNNEKLLQDFISQNYYGIKLEIKVQLNKEKQEDIEQVIKQTFKDKIKYE